MGFDIIRPSSRQPSDERGHHDQQASDGRRRWRSPGQHDRQQMLDFFKHREEAYDDLDADRARR
jgi:hypothetical protein